MANEMRRVGRGYYCQTPNFKFPIEPHFLAPFLHWLPVEIRVLTARRFSIWGLMERPSFEKADTFVRSIHLLTSMEMDSLFPGAQRIDEYVLGIRKSLVAVRKADL